MRAAGVVIVGGGQGGFQVAASLRDAGYAGTVTIVADEPGLPYQRPPLSKGFLTGKVTPEQIDLRPATFYAERAVTLLAPEQATRIDRAARELTLASGAKLPYEHLVLATGSRPRMPAVPGVGLEGVMALRTRADAQALLARLHEAKRVAVVGGGFIGLEISVVARELGLEVTLIEFADRVLTRSVSVEAASFLTRAQMRRGVEFLFDSGATAFTGAEGRVTGVQTRCGRAVPADLVVVGVGVQANGELAQSAGLAVDDGIVVDEQLLTADAAISAIGDCARFPAPYCARPLRIESVQNAVDQARCVAARIAGKPQPYAKVPWFWSDQGDQRLQIAGVAEPGDESVVRGDVAQGKFSVFRFRAGRLAAVESINSAADHMAARKLLAQPAGITAAQAADTNLKLAALVAA